MRPPTDDRWLHVFRAGIAPQLTTRHLELLRDGLSRDDKRIRQGLPAGVYPPAHGGSAFGRAEAACPLGFCRLAEDDAASVEDVMHFIGRAALAANVRLREWETGAVRMFFAAMDDSPRAWLLSVLLDEVKREIESRKAVTA